METLHGKNVVHARWRAHFGLQRHLCILLPGRFVHICAAISSTHCHDRYQVFLIVHCTIFSEHFGVIELLGNSAHKRGTYWHRNGSACHYVDHMTGSEAESKQRAWYLFTVSLRSAVKLNNCHLLNLSMGNVCSLSLSFFAVLHETVYKQVQIKSHWRKANLIDGWPNITPLVSCPGVQCQTHQRPQVFIWRLEGINDICCFMLKSLSCYKFLLSTVCTMQHPKHLLGCY